jgi:hypothetical protein
LEFLELCHSCTPVPTSPTSHFFRMESECNQNDSTMKPEPDPPDLLSSKDDKIMNLLVAISNQMMANTQDLQNQILRNHRDLQEQLIQNDLKLTADIQRLSQDHETFKQQSRAALISLQNAPLPAQASHVSTTIPFSSSVVGSRSVGNSLGLSSDSPSFVPSLSIENTLLPQTSATVGPDLFQNQMLQMLNDTFSKLSTVISETKAGTKSE